MWLFYALITVALTTILGTTMRLSAIKAKDPRSYAFAYNILGLTILGILLCIQRDFKIELNWYLAGLLFVSGLGYGLFHRLQFLVRKHVESSELATITTAATVIGYLLAIFWLGEPFKIVRFIGYVIIILAALSVLQKQRKFVINKYAFLGLMIGSAIAVSGVIDRRTAPQFSSVLLYVGFIWLAQTIVVFVPKISLQSVRAEFKLHGVWLPALVCLNLLQTFTVISAVRLAPATQVQPILASNVIFIALAGILFLHERERKWLKLAAALLATIGLLLVSS